MGGTGVSAAGTGVLTGAAGSRVGGTGVLVDDTAVAMDSAVGSSASTLVAYSASGASGAGAAVQASSDTARHIAAEIVIIAVNLRVGCMKY